MHGKALPLLYLRENSLSAHVLSIRLLSAQKSWKKMGYFGCRLQAIWGHGQSFAFVLVQHTSWGF